MKLILTLCALVISLAQNAQEVLSTGGGTLNVSGYQVSHTLGEIVVQSSVNSDFIITQGFHQSDLIVTQVAEQSFEMEILVYPNPSQDFITIKTPHLEEFTLRLYDLKGKLIMEKQIIGAQSVIDLTFLASGIYGLMIQGINEKHSWHTIQKMK